MTVDMGWRKSMMSCKSRHNCGLRNLFPGYGGTALHQAADRGLEKVVARLLAECPFLIDVQWTGWTALHFAAENGHEAIVAQLVAAKLASVDARTNEGLTALHLAAHRGHEAIVARLLAAKPASIEARTDKGWTPLHYAVKGGSRNIVAQLLAADPALIEAKTNDGRTVLHCAADMGHDGIGTQLLAARPALLDVMVNDADSWAALLNVISLGHAEATARVLAMHPHLIYNTSDRGWTVFHYAARYGREQVISRLLAAVVQPDLEQLLLRRSTRQAECTCAGSTALHVATIEGSFPTVVAQLLAACPALIYAVDDNNQTCLHYAARRPHVSTMEILLDFKPVLVHAVDADGNTLLHSMLLFRVHGMKLIERVWKMNPDALRAVNRHGETPFHIAVDTRRHTVIDLLQWGLTFDEIVSAHNKCKTGFVERLKPLIERQCEEITAVMLIPDVVATVFEYLGLRETPGSHSDTTQCVTLFHIHHDNTRNNTAD